MEIIKESLNLWNYDIYLRWWYISTLKKFSDTKTVTVVMWQRRVGKSFVVLWFLKKYGLNIQNTFYLNKELDINNQIATNIDLNWLFHKYVKKYWDPKYIVVDEIQDIDEWERFIRWVYAKKKYKIIISGSNSKLLSWELATFLTWRYLCFEVYPFSYKECLDFKKVKHTKETFDDYLKYWWLPEILMQTNLLIKNNYLLSILQNLIYNDIVKRYKIWNENLLERLIKYLSDNIWSLVSTRNIEKFLKSERIKVSVSTICSYISYMENSFLIRKTDRYDIKWKQYLQYISKYYFNDIWLRNVFIWFNVNDIWKLLENIVFIHLLNLWYWVNVWVIWDNEIDFIATKWWEKKYIQVSYLIYDKKVKQREFWNLLKIKDAHEKIVISMDQIANWNIDGIKWINIENFLLEYK